MHLLLQAGTVWLDTALPDEENRQSLLFVQPVRVLQADVADQVPALLQALDAALAAGYYVAGYLTYEAGYALVPARLPIPEETGPLAWFGVYTQPHRLTAEAAAALLASTGSYRVQDMRVMLPLKAYRERIEVIRTLIREGEVYQLNFTLPIFFRFEGDPVAFYRSLRRQQPVPYGAFLNTGDRFVLSLSPELFFRRKGERIVTRPMKGTMRRSWDPEEDRALAEVLQNDPKNQAENLMIVDLLRNDLSVCCQPGSVVVPQLFHVAAYPTLWQMTSTVEGTLQPGVGYAELFRAIFPSGSVTGAPKLRAMQHLRHLEPSHRGVYCGAIGYAAPGGEAVFNVAIRTLELIGSEGRLGVGSGIVWDSDPEAEYAECLLKSQFLHIAAEPFALIETMRCVQGAIPLLEAHLDRLRRSAACFGFPLDEAALRVRLRQVAQALDPAQCWRLRLTLDEHGRVVLTSAVLEPEPERPWQLCVAAWRLDAADPLRYHKTTRRAEYEAAYLKARAAGYDEVIFLNTRGEVCEGSRTNIFAQIEGRLYTPPVHCGLLPGVYRAHVLSTRPEATEKVLTLDDLRRAEALYVCNAVRGWQSAVLVPEEIACS